MTETRRSIKGHLRAFKIDIKNGEDPLIQLQETQPEVNRFLGNLLGEMGGFKFSEALEIEFSWRTAEGKNKHRGKYCDSKQQVVINRSTI